MTSVSGSDSDCVEIETHCNACNCDHEMDHTPQNVGSRVMLLKIKKARLETQVAYTRTRLLLAEMELRMAEEELLHEVKKNSPAPKTPTRPQRKTPHKLVKLLSRVFKPANQNTEEPDTTDLEVKEAKKRKNVGETEKRNKLKKSTDSLEKENRNSSRINTQYNRQETTDPSKKVRKDKSKNTSDKKETETKIKEKKSTEKNEAGNKKHTDSKTKHSRRHKHEKGREKDNNHGKVGKALKSILKKTSITEERNNNVPKNMSTDVRGINEDSVEFNIRTISFSAGQSSNSYGFEIDTNVDKALDTIAEIPENIFIKKEVTEHIYEKGILEVVDAMLESQNVQLFKELRDERQEASSLGSMETLVLDEESQDGKF